MSNQASPSHTYGAPSHQYHRYGKREQHPSVPCDEWSLSGQMVRNPEEKLYAICAFSRSVDPFYHLCKAPYDVPQRDLNATVCTWVSYETARALESSRARAGQADQTRTAELDKWEKQYGKIPQLFREANETFGGGMSVEVRIKDAGQCMWKTANDRDPQPSFRDYHHNQLRRYNPRLFKDSYDSFVSHVNTAGGMQRPIQRPRPRNDWAQLFTVPQTFNPNPNPPLSQDPAGLEYVVPLEVVMAGHGTNSQQPDLSMAAFAAQAPQSYGGDSLGNPASQYQCSPAYGSQYGQGPSTYGSQYGGNQWPPQ